MRLHLSDLSLAEQAMTLGLDTVRDADEYSASVDVVEELSSVSHYGIDRLLARLQRHDDEWSRRLLLRIRNLGLAGWSVGCVGRGLAHLAGGRLRAMVSQPARSTMLTNGRWSRWPCWGCCTIATSADRCCW